MKITRGQLRRVIREAITRKLLQEETVDQCEINIQKTSGGGGTVTATFKGFHGQQNFEMSSPTMANKKAACMFARRKHDDATQAERDEKSSAPDYD